MEYSIDDIQERRNAGTLAYVLLIIGVLFTLQGWGLLEVNEKK